MTRPARPPPDTVPWRFSLLLLQPKNVVLRTDPQLHEVRTAVAAAMESASLEEQVDCIRTVLVDGRHMYELLMRQINTDPCITPVVVRELVAAATATARIVGPDALLAMQQAADEGSSTQHLVRTLMETCAAELEPPPPWQDWPIAVTDWVNGLGVEVASTMFDTWGDEINAVVGAVVEICPEQLWATALHAVLLGGRDLKLVLAAVMLDVRVP